MNSQRRRDHGSGSIHQRSSDQMWVGTLENGFTPNGTRRRIVVYAKTEAAVKRKLRDRKTALDRGETVGNRITVKQWAEKYLALRVRELAPKGYNAAASPINKWVVPTIGHRRLEALTPADLRAVVEAQRDAGLKGTTAAATQRALKTMLNHAVEEGHHVPANVFKVKAPKTAPSDRAALSVEEGLACLAQAATMPDGVRWLITLLYGMRQGECTGLTWDQIDFDAAPFGEIVIEWQLQALPYNVARDPSSGFRLPDDYECRHLTKAFHLVRPKSGSGWRVAPLLPPVRDALLAWREVAPANPWGLVFPTPEGGPCNDKKDREAWWALQDRAGVAHPGGRPFHVHETRNFAATMLLEAGVDEHVVTSLLGHSSIVMSRKYLTVRREPLVEALLKVGERLQLTPGANV